METQEKRSSVEYIINFGIYGALMMHCRPQTKMLESGKLIYFKQTSRKNLT